MRARPRSGWCRSQAGFLVLIELLIVVLIIAALASFYLTSGGMGGTSGGTRTGPGGEPTTMPGKARDQAESVVCRNNLQQVRAAIATQLATAGSNPSDLESLQIGVPLTCPVGGEPYTYDASTGQVHCTHPGHESY